MTSPRIEHEVAVIVLRDKAGHYFINRRRDDKKVFPGKWGVGAGGKLNPGEPPAAAAARELLEETGIVAMPRFSVRNDIRRFDLGVASARLRS